jgi:hypothetical protein
MLRRILGNLSLRGLTAFLLWLYFVRVPVIVSLVDLLMGPLGYSGARQFLQRPPLYFGLERVRAALLRRVPGCRLVSGLV